MNRTKEEMRKNKQSGRQYYSFSQKTKINTDVYK